MSCAGSILTVALAAASAEADNRGRPVSRPARPATTTPTGGDNVVIYKSGVCINWTKLQVELLGKVALREGALELFACARDVYGGDKTHESIVLLDGRPLHIYQALGLIGLQPGRPARWDAKSNKMIPATGQPLELRVEWIFDDRRHQVDVSEWMQRMDKPAKPLGPLPWVFAGSARTPEGILADEDGTAITVVDFEGSIVTLPDHHPRDYEQLWVEARPDKIPPLNIPCTVIVRAAGLSLRMDRFGRLFVNRRSITPDDLVERVRRELKRLPNARVTVTVAPTALKADVEALRKRLRSAGVPEGAVRIEREPASKFPADDADAGRAFLRDQFALQRSLIGSAQNEHRRLVDQLTTRRARFEQGVTRIGDYIARLQDGLTYLADEPSQATTTSRSVTEEAVGPPHASTRSTPTSSRR